MAQYQIDEKTRLKRHWGEQAISLAMQNRWQDAVSINRKIIELFPNDVDALNRMGRALTELGQYAEARESYSRALEVDRHNMIARRNLDRLSTITETGTATKAHAKVDPRIFVAETGKSGVTALVRTAPRDVLAQMTVGDQVYLKPEGRALLVLNASQQTLGQVEPRLSQRLIDLMKGGNNYAAAVVSLDDTQVRVIIRETYQDPSQLGKVAFPSRGPEPTVRPYIKGSVIRYELDEDEEEENLEEPEYAVDSDADSEDGGPVTESEFGEEEELES
jgi:tetratricopeptide (TPR) repeat protein